MEEHKAAIRQKPSRSKPWSDKEGTTLAKAQEILDALESTNSQRVVGVSYGRPARNEKPAYDTLIEIAISGPNGRSTSWIRLFISNIPDAKRLMAQSPKILKFLRCTAQAL
jgi:hypothetical protein